MMSAALPSRRSAWEPAAVATSVTPRATRGDGPIVRRAEEP
jgi:hypothetical protein